MLTSHLAYNFLTCKDGWEHGSVKIVRVCTSQGFDVIPNLDAEAILFTFPAQGIDSEHSKKKHVTDPVAKVSQVSE